MKKRSRWWILFLAETAIFVFAFMMCLYVLPLTHVGVCCGFWVGRLATAFERLTFSYREDS